MNDKKYSPKFEIFQKSSLVSVCSDTINLIGKNCAYYALHFAFGTLLMILHPDSIRDSIFIYSIPLILLSLSLIFAMLMKLKSTSWLQGIKGFNAFVDSLLNYIFHIYLIETIILHQNCRWQIMLVSLWAGSHWSLNIEKQLKSENKSKKWKYTLFFLISVYPIIRGALNQNYCILILSFINASLIFKEVDWIREVRRMRNLFFPRSKNKPANTDEISSRDSQRGIVLPNIPSCFTTENKLNPVYQKREITLNFEEINLFYEVLNLFEDSIVALNMKDEPTFYNNCFDTNFGPAEGFKEKLKSNFFVQATSNKSPSSPNSRDKSGRIKALQQEFGPMKSGISQSSNSSFRKSDVRRKGTNQSKQECGPTEYETLDSYIQNTKSGIMNINIDPEHQLDYEMPQNNIATNNSMNIIMFLKETRKILFRQIIFVDTNPNFISRGYQSSRYELEIIFYCYVASSDKLKFPNKVHYILRFHKQALNEQRDNSIYDNKDFDSFKVKILSSISHELRTPLNCSINLLEMLLDTSKKELQTLDLLVSALNNCKLLMGTIDDILDYSSMMASSFKLRICRFSLRELINDAINLLSFLAKERSNTIKLDFDENIPLEITSDPFRIKQIFMNLLLNANKYTNTGRISINIKQISLGLFRISVKDTGVGMDSSVLKRLGILNGRSDNKLIGLGLTISNYICSFLAPPEYPGITFKTEEGIGSQFTFHIIDTPEHVIFNEFDSYKSSEKIASNKQIKYRKKYPKQKYNRKLISIDAEYLNNNPNKPLSCEYSQKNLSVSDSETIKKRQTGLKGIDSDEQLNELREELDIQLSDVFKAPPVVLKRLNTLHNMGRQKSCNTQLDGFGLFAGFKNSSSPLNSEKGGTESWIEEDFSKLKNEPADSDENSRVKFSEKSINLETTLAPSVKPNFNLQTSTQIRTLSNSRDGKNVPNQLSICAKEELYSFKLLPKKGEVIFCEENLKFKNTEGGLNNKKELKTLLQAINKRKLCDCSDILLVDDNGYNLMVLRMMLESLGFKTDSAISGDLAIKKVQERFDKAPNNICRCYIYKIIFMDLDMPVKDGFVTTTEIQKIIKSKQREGRQCSIIIACTAFNETEYGGKCRDCGMKDFISKPVKKAILEEKLIKYLPKFL